MTGVSRATFKNYKMETLEFKCKLNSLFNKALFEMYRKKQAKANAKEFAIDAQNIISENNFSYGEIADISDTLHSLGKRFVLVREFKENCIC